MDASQPVRRVCSGLARLDSFLQPVRDNGFVEISGGNSPHSRERLAGDQLSRSWFSGVSWSEPGAVHSIELATFAVPRDAVDMVCAYSTEKHWCSSNDPRKSAPVGASFALVLSASVQASAKFCQFQCAGGLTGFVLISPAVLKPLNPKTIQARTRSFPPR